MNTSLPTMSGARYVFSSISLSNSLRTKIRSHSMPCPSPAMIKTCQGVSTHKHIDKHGIRSGTPTGFTM